MPRPKASKPSYYTSRGAWYCWLDGKQHLLISGPKEETEAAALETFYRLQLAAKENRIDRNNTSVMVCLDIYCVYCKQYRKKATLEVRRKFCQDFIRRSDAALRPVSELKKQDILDWLAKHPKWCDSTKATGIMSINAALNHCREQGVIDTNPIAGMKKPKCRSRSKECVLSKTEQRQIAEYASGSKYMRNWFALFIEALHQTGARPGELSSVTADELKCIQGVWVLDLSKWKTDRFAGKSRLVVLTDTLAAKLREQATKYPSGPIFRNRFGKRMKHSGIAENFERIREALGLREQITAYSYRHTFATEWLLAGESVALLAQMLGNSVRTIEHHYSHLLHDVGRLKDRLDKMRGTAS